MFKKDDNYDTIDNVKKTITDLERTKVHIANYFKTLYQAREGETSHIDFTNHINETVDNIEHSPANCEAVLVTIEELDHAICHLKQDKSCGPNHMPNEAIINADKNTKQIILETINDIQKGETIPKQGAEGEVTRL